MTKGGEGEVAGWKKEGVTRFAVAAAERLSLSGTNGAEGDGLTKDGWWWDGVAEGGGMDGWMGSGW